MSLILDEKDYVHARLTRKVMDSQGSPEEQPETEDRNLAALVRLADAVRVVAEKPAPNLTPLIDAIRQVQETQTKLLNILAENPARVEAVRNWEFTVTHDHRGDIKGISAKGKP